MDSSPLPTVLVIDKEAAVLQALRRFHLEPTYRLLTSGTGADGLRQMRASCPDVVVLDTALPDVSGMEVFRHIRRTDPRIPVIFLTSQGSAQGAIDAIKEGAYDYLLKPAGVGQLREVLASAVRVSRLTRAPATLDPNVPEGGDVLIGCSAPMQEIYKAIGRVAPQDVNVLILGESGTGKELVARAIYQNSRRADRPFLAVNCAAIPETLLESELFGHERGAFTGADRRRIGKFEQANGGTLFLDEVGDMTPLTQAKVLRVLQEQTFERVGGDETIRTDVRVLAATNHDLERMTREGRFRADLFYRLSVYGISLPPLRERLEDLPLLVEHFLIRYARELGKEVRATASEALELLGQHCWPGNVRELQSVLKQALLRAAGPVLLPEFLSLPRPSPLNGRSDAEFAALDRFLALRLAAGTTNLEAESRDLIDRHLLTRVLEYTAGNQLRAARVLGITRGTLRNRLRALGLSAERGSDPDISLENRQA